MSGHARASVTCCCCAVLSPHTRFSYVSVAFFGTEPSPEVDKGAGVKVTAVLCMLLFNFVNCLGVKLGAKVQGVFVVLKFVAVGFVMIAGVYQVVSKVGVLPRRAGRLHRADTRRRGVRSPRYWARTCTTHSRAPALPASVPP